MPRFLLACTQPNNEGVSETAYFFGRAWTTDMSYAAQHRPFDTMDEAEKARARWEDGRRRRLESGNRDTINTATQVVYSVVEID